MTVTYSKFAASALTALTVGTAVSVEVVTSAVSVAVATTALIVANAVIVAVATTVDLATAATVVLYNILQLNNFMSQYGTKG